MQNELVCGRAAQPLVVGFGQRAQIYHESLN